MAQTHPRQDLRCDEVGCQTQAVAHVTVAEDRSARSEHHFCQPHAEEFFGRRERTPQFWAAVPDPPAGSVVFEVSAVAYHQPQGKGVLYLHERGGKREFPILTGWCEYAEADRLLKRKKYPRPLTHDVAVSILRELRGELQWVSVDRLEEFCYYASLHIRTGGNVVVIDVRPSDAIIMALHTGAQILVSDETLNTLEREGQIRPAG